MTPAQQRKALERERRAYLKEQARATLRELKSHLAMARAAHKGRLAEVRAACRADKHAVKDRVRAMRKLARIELAARVRDEKAGAVLACRGARQRPRVAAGAEEEVPF
jgi:hypothetical protein